MSLSLEEIKKIKTNILLQLLDDVKEINENSGLTDHLSIIVIFGINKNPSRFDLEIKFHSPDDFDYFDIISPISKKPLTKINQEQVNEVIAKRQEIEDKYTPLLKKAMNSQEKARIMKEKNLESMKIKFPEEEKLEKLDKNRVLEIIEFFKKYSYNRK